MLIGKRFHFDAAHQHPHEGAGACHRLHGHTYRVEIVLQGDQVATSGPMEGMLLDLGVLGAWWKSELEPHLDHQNLEDTIPAKFLPTTIENLAAFILEEARETFPEIASVRVQEGETQWAIAIA